MHVLYVPGLPVCVSVCLSVCAFSCVFFVLSVCLCVCSVVYICIVCGYGSVACMCI